ncbi:sensor histidine kinase [Pseudotenacibaculum haliotis]|uniref:Sensor histidine kinase n=1 Tax=Pseudotenacibaculum haliotis TaxID=1862138 RepID=A0ABW5LQD4_9FLAO
MNKELKYNLIIGALLVLIGETWDISIDMIFDSSNKRWGNFSAGGFLLFFTFNIAYFSVYVLNYRVFAPRFLRLDKIPQFILAFFTMVLCFASVRFFLEEVLAQYYFGIHNYNLDRPNIVAIYLTDSAGYSLRPILFSSMVYLFFRYAEKTKLLHELKVQHQEAQMAMLQSQIGPHFLFNTLNGFYSDLYDKNPEAANGILKLSQLLRYVTYEVKEDFMPLEKELKFLKDYLYFYKKRYENHFYVDLQINGEVGKQKVPSLILIHFVENVCKHGVIDDETKPARIQIDINNDCLKIATQNSINSSEKYMDKGIGTENIKSRLNVLFKDNYELSYQSEDQQFRTYLKMPL